MGSPAFSVAALDFIAFTGIFGKSSDIAGDIDAGVTASNWDAFLLAASLRLAPMYSTQGAPNNDGL